MNISDNQYNEILEAVKFLKIENKFLELFDLDLLKELQRIFVNGNPRVWWLSLKYLPTRLKGNDELEYLEISNQFNPCSQGFFITELDEIHIFKAEMKYIQAVIGECSFFEYYIIDDKKEKFFCETDHGDILYIDININQIRG